MPPGSGLTTDTAIRPPMAGPMVALTASWFGDMNFAGTADMPTRTCDTGKNPDPVTVMICGPNVSWEGSTLEITGSGLRRVTSALPATEASATLTASIVIRPSAGATLGAE